MRLVPAIALGALALLPAAAHGATVGDYTHYVCSVPETGQGLGVGIPDGMTNPGSDERWKITGSTTNCDAGPIDGFKNGVMLGMDGGNYAVGTWSALHYTTPETITIAGGSYWRTLVDAAPNAGSIALNQQGSGDPSAIFGAPMNAVDQGDWYSGNTNRGNRNAPFDEANHVRTIAYAPHAWDITLACRANATTCSVPAGTIRYRLYAAKVLLHDSTDPQVDRSGELVTDDTLRGTRSLTVRGTDTGSGVYRAIVALDGAVVATRVVDDNAGRCADVYPGDDDPREFAYQVPCKLAVAKTLTFDTTAWPEGAHHMVVTVEDAGGNAAAVLDRQVTVDNVPPPTSLSVPQVSGTARTGSGLALDDGAWDGHAQALAFTYGWQRSADGGKTWQDIEGAVGRTYALTAGDAGEMVRGRVRATSSEGATDAYSEPLGPVAVPEAPATPDAPVQGTTPAPDAASPGSRSTSGGSGGAAAATTAPANSADGRVGTRIVVHSAASHTERRTVTVRYGTRARLTGRLLDAAGHPVAGARVEVQVQRRVPSAALHTVRTVTTDRDGVFHYTAGRGPSRLVRFAYRSHSQDASFAFVRDVVVRVRAGLSFRAAPRHTHNHHRVTFHGRLRGTRAPKIVELQVRKGAAWQTFATVRARHGKYRFHYRFRRTTAPTTYRFRARVRAERGFPYLTAHTKSRSVHVRP